MRLTIRELTESDAAATLALVNLGAPEPATLDQIRERLRRHLDGSLVLRVGAFDDERMIGYAHALRHAWMPRGLFWVHVVVAPDARRRGAGARLFATARGFAGQLGATTFRGEVRDIEPGSLAFAERMGFRVERHIFESTLDLAAFDETPFLAAIETASAPGIRFFSMAEAGDGADQRRQLYELNRALAADIPGGSEASLWPYEAFVRQVVEDANYMPEGQLIAAEDDRWVGLAAILRIPNANNAMYNGMTGVLPAYRGCGIATALKLLAIRVAASQGATYLRTNNDSENAPMLAINRKLGYRPEPGYYRMIADVTRAAH